MKTRAPLLVVLALLLVAGCDGLTDASSTPDELLAPPHDLLRVARTGDATASSKAAVYASTVAFHQQGVAVPTGTIASNRSIPANALDAPNTDFFSLGFDVFATPDTEGVIVLGFGTGQLLRSLTVTVWEESYSGSGAPLESADVYVGEHAGGPWTLIGRAHNNGSVSNTRPTELPLANRCVAFVRLVDRTNRAQYTSSLGDGFDVNAVELDSDGACVTAGTVSGSVYVDADEDASRDAFESGVSNVVVELLSGATVVQSTTTDAAGSYTFTAPEGAYTVRVPVAAASAFNADLYEWYTYTGLGAASAPVAIGASPGMADFGFAPQVAELTEALKTGEVDTDAKDDKFWARQLRHAALPSRARVDVSAAQLAQYLTQIESLLLTRPFQFGTGNRYGVALEIVAEPTQGDVEKFLRELLTAELNYVSGRGTGDDAFDLAILAFGESIAVLEADASMGKGAAVSLAEATTLLRAYNSSGGGGGVGGQ